MKGPTQLVSVAFAVNFYAEAFLQVPTLSPLQKSVSSSSRLHGIQEWRDQALEYKYTLDSYSNGQPSSDSSNSPNLSEVPAVLPIFPFPFSDILMQGERKQLNLYEQRFHDLFQDAMDNHCGMVGMGLLAGNGMITSLPLCEVESFSKFGATDDWVDRGDGMGNGSIFVTIRAVGRCKIVEADLLEEEPYMKARVAELCDEEMAVGGLREKQSEDSTVVGESSALSVASSVGGNIENIMVSLARMEHQLKEMEKMKKKKTVEGTGSRDGNEGGGGDEVMNRRMVNAQLVRIHLS